MTRLWQISETSHAHSNNGDSQRVSYGSSAAYLLSFAVCSIASERSTLFSCPLASQHPSELQSASAPGGLQTEPLHCLRINQQPIHFSGNSVPTLRRHCLFTLACYRDPASVFRAVHAICNKQAQFLSEIHNYQAKYSPLPTWCDNDRPFRQAVLDLWDVKFYVGTWTVPRGMKH